MPAVSNSRPNHQGMSRLAVATAITGILTEPLPSGPFITIFKLVGPRHINHAEYSNQPLAPLTGVAISAGTEPFLPAS